MSGLPFAIMFLVSMMITLQEVRSECCTVGGTHGRGNRCGDDSDGTPCCGYKPCNIFCCNCDSSDAGFVCRVRGGQSLIPELAIDNGTAVSHVDAKGSGALEVLSKYDTNKDGKLDIDEFGHGVGGRIQQRFGMADLVSVFAGHDLNHDGFITADEIDHS